jgi:isocitrate lyase
LQEAEFAAEEHGYTATKHQREVGAGYFDEVAQIVAGGAASTTALTGSTEEAQFDSPESPVTGLSGSTENEQFVK